MKPLVLVVDDESDIRELITMTLEQMNIDVVSSPDLKTAYELLRKHHLSFCLSDMRLPDGDGITLVKYIQEYYPNVPVAMITAFGNVEGAVNTLKAGAFDYVSKPVDLTVLRRLVETAIRLSQKIESAEKTTLLGESQQMLELDAKITKLARSQAPVFIHGPSGTGKELVARLLHARGPRADKSFVPVNCGAVPLELMESEFFGHKKGSFTGATTDKEGLFQAAEGGTLFLDEVADLPLLMQVKLLRAIQEKAVRPIGSQKEISIDVRVLSASHQNLAQLVAEGGFREDLYYRINVIELKIPSLQHRKEDIPLLAAHFLKQFAGRHQVSVTITDEAIARLNAYSFPGNVRELENILERALIMCEGGCIDADDLHLREVVQVEEAPLNAVLVNTERQTIVDALVRHQWNRTQAAKELGLSLRQLRYRLSKLEL